MSHMISEAIRRGLIGNCPRIKDDDELNRCFIECVEQTDKRFIFIIDEWDAGWKEGSIWSYKNKQP